MRLKLLYRAIALFAFCIPAFVGADPGPALFTQGVEFYKQHQWMDAMNAFISVLNADPRNTMAHKYMDAIAREVAHAHREAVEQQRLDYLQGAAIAIKAPPASPVTNALASIIDADDTQKEDRWKEKLEEARMHKDLGQLLQANDLILQILAEKPDHTDAQRELSDLQSRLHKALDADAVLSIEDRYAYEGFYAYGQADYATAATAWSKARSVVEQNAAGTQRNLQLKALCFEPYEKIAQAHVNEESEQGSLHALFQQGVAAFEAQHFEEALDTFRKLALRAPDYPQLAHYLIEAETGAEKMRAKRLGEEKRQEIVKLYERGVDELEKEHFSEAENNFGRVLALDPSHSQARAYLAMAKAENERRHDPKAAQMHYETGLIAYASGKLDEAVREWNMAIRMNPNHPKARIALAKVEKELALSRESGDTP